MRTATVKPEHRPLLLMLARDCLAELRTARAEYDEECRRHWEQGHRPATCPHGTDWWVDYDPICLMCEDGVTILEEAMAYAWWRYHRWQERWQAWSTARSLGMPGADAEATVAWAIEPILITHKPVTHRLGDAA